MKTITVKCCGDCVFAQWDEIQGWDCHHEDTPYEMCDIENTEAILDNCPLKENDYLIKLKF